jgi:hypothetical protein
VKAAGCDDNKSGWIVGGVQALGKLQLNFGITVIATYNCIASCSARSIR